jgi:hypothetical protein
MIFMFPSTLMKFPEVGMKTGMGESRREWETRHALRSCCRAVPTAAELRAKNGAYFTSRAYLTGSFKFFR